MAEPIPLTGQNLGGTLTGVANLANLFLPQTTNTSGSQTVQDNRSSTTRDSGGTTTVTTSNNVSPGAVDALIKNILEGTNGLAAVSSGQRTAGLYGSSTNQLLTNDLIARAAGEGAKLNQTQTQTTVRPETTQSTQNSGGQTTTSNQTAQRQAPVSGSVAGTAGAALAALQLIPKDIKDNILSGLGIKVGGKGASNGAASGGAASAAAADRIAPSTNDPAGFAALESSAVGTDGLGQSVAGSGVSNFTDQYLGSASNSGIDLSAGADQDISGGYSLTGADAAVEGGGSFFDGAGESIVAGLGDVGDALGGFAAGIGDTISDWGSSVGDWFSDFDFSFADGGAVSIDDFRKKMVDHVSSKMSLADGGVSSKGIGAVGDTRYGNGAQAQPAKSGARGGNIFEETRNKRERDAGLVPSETEVMQQGFVPRTVQERQSVFTLIDTIPQLLNALLGNDSPKPQGKADGGEVSRPKHFANGGSVSTAVGNDVYDLSGVSYLANTGLTAQGPDVVRALSASSNDQVVDRMIKDNIRPTAQSDLEAAQRTAAPVRSARIVNPTEEVAVAAQESNGPGVSVGEGIGTVGGIANAIGVSPSVGQAGISGLAGLAGIAAPGLAGLANAPNNNAAVNAMISAMIGLANPVAGMIASAALSQINPSTPSPGGASGGISGSSVGEGNTTASVSVGEAGGVDADGDGVSNADAPGASGTTSTSGIGDDGGGSASADAGVGADGSSGGDGGADGAGYADGGTPGIRVAQARANPETTSDKIPAMLSEDEYVLPADVTAALGIDFLDSLVDRFHVPAAKQQAAHRRA